MYITATGSLGLLKTGVALDVTMGKGFSAVLWI